jgi:hypothetical protein
MQVASRVVASVVTALGIIVLAQTAIHAQQTQVVPPGNREAIHLWGAKLQFVDLPRSNGPGLHVVPNPGNDGEHQHRGLKVVRVHDGPARHAGVERGDIIVRIGEYWTYDDNSLREALLRNRGSHTIRTKVINVRNGHFTWVDVRPHHGGGGEPDGGGGHPAPEPRFVYDISIRAQSFQGHNNTESGDEEYEITYSVHAPDRALFTERNTFEDYELGRKRLSANGEARGLSADSVIRFSTSCKEIDNSPNPDDSLGNSNQSLTISELLDLRLRRVHLGNNNYNVTFEFDITRRQVGR